jgi:hypothetical protein
LGTNSFGKADNSFQRIEDKSISISKKTQKKMVPIRVVAITQHNKRHLFPQLIQSHQIKAIVITYSIMGFFFCIR